MDYAELKERMREYPDTMTDGERGKAYAAGERVDRIPFSIQSNEQAMAGVYGYTTKQFIEDPQVNIDVLRRRWEDFQIGGIACKLQLRSVGEAVGSKMYQPEVGIDRVAEPILEDLAGLNDVLKNDPYTNPYYQKILERGHVLKDAFPNQGIATVVAGPLTTASAIRPVEKLLRDSRKNPKELHELLDFCVYHAVAWVEMVVKEFGPVGCGICDPVTCFDIVSAKQYHELTEPYLKKLIAGITAATGGKPGIHICGRTSPLWPDMLDLQCASFSVDNREDLEEAKQVLGSTFALVGNVSPVDVMLLGSIDDVIEACKSCIIKAAESPLGYTLGTGCQVPIGTPRENFDAFIYAAKKYGRGAKKGELPEGIFDKD